MGEINCVDCKEQSCATLNLNEEELGLQITVGHDTTYRAMELIIKEDIFTSNIAYHKPPYLSARYYFISIFDIKFLSLPLA